MTRNVFPIFVAILLVTSACSGAQAVENEIGKTGSLDCKSIIFSYGVHSRNHFEDNIVSACADGSNQVRLTIDGKGNAGPAWSPDGSEIAFISTRLGNQQLYVMEATGGNVRQITDGLEIAPSFMWLPTGSEIALRVLQEDGSWGWVAVNTTTTAVSSLDWPLASVISVAELSHDGSRMAYVQAMQPANPNGPKQIRIQDTNGSNDYALTDDKWDNYNPVWSADDSRLAFLTNRDGLEGLFAIYSVNADGSDLGALTEPIFSVGSFFSWSPDGGSVAVFSDGAIYVMNLASEDMTKLFTVDYPNYVSNFSWQP